MTRRRYVQIDGELVEVSPDYVAEPRNHDAMLWNDHAYQDMNDPRFNSRSTHREYMKKHGLTTIDDMHGEWKRAEKKRIDVRKGIDPTRKQDLISAYQKLKNGAR